MKKRRWDADSQPSKRVRRRHNSPNSYFDSKGQVHKLETKLPGISHYASPGRKRCRNDNIPDSLPKRSKFELKNLGQSRALVPFTSAVNKLVHTCRTPPKIHDGERFPPGSILVQNNLINPSSFGPPLSHHDASLSFGVAQKAREQHEPCRALVIYQPPEKLFERSNNDDGIERANSGAMEME